MAPFTHSIDAYIAHRKDAALAEVGRLRHEVLSYPARAAIIDTIAANCTPDIPELRGQTQTEKTSDDYLEVIVPFVGDAFFINLRPSQYNDPQLPFEVSGNAFVVTIPDDDNLEKPLERFVNSTNANLASMRQEFERGLKTLRAELEAAAITRLAHLEAEKARHAKLPFPVKDNRTRNSRLFHRFPKMIIAATRSAGRHNSMKKDMTLS
jgi:hypothetical protein